MTEAEKWWMTKNVDERLLLGEKYFTELDGLDLLPHEIELVYLKEQVKEEPLSVSVEEAAIKASSHTAGQFHFKEGANFQKQQSEELIKELSICLQRFITVTEREPILLGQNEGAVRQAKSAIEKANNYLNQSK